MTTLAAPLAQPHPSSGARLASSEGRALPLVSTRLSIEARGGIARTRLEQRFANQHAEPLSVSYLLPLPADGAVSGFRFRIGERTVTGEVDQRARARRRFEEAVASGHTAALVEEERQSLFQQELGNIPPHTDVFAELSIDQPLAWLAGEGAWELRFPTSAAPRYLGAPGRVADARQITVDVASGPIAPRMQLALAIGDAITGAPESPSHALRAEEERAPGAADGPPVSPDAPRAAGSARGSRVMFAEEAGAPLDRDLVIRWKAAQAALSSSLEVARDVSPALASRAFGLFTLVPPARAGAAVPRDLIVLLDTSGSMSGEPLMQSQRIASALIESLSDQDSLELIEFSNEPRRWKKEAARATAGEKQSALRWVRSLRASGGTEMRTGIVEALAGLRAESQRQIVLVTDGLIGFESEIVATLLARLPRGSRLHAVGVGSSVNRALTRPAARAGRGAELILGLGEDPERAARRLLAHTASPLVVDLELAGSALLAHAPERLPDLYAGLPARLCVELRPEGGELIARGRAAEGEWVERLHVAAIANGEQRVIRAGEPRETASGPGALAARQGSDAVDARWPACSAVAALFGREQVEDLEMNAAARDVREPSSEARLEALGVTFQLATRLTSWIALTDEATVDPTQPTRRETMPHQLPYGMQAEGLGLRPASGPVHAMPVMAMAAAPRGQALGGADLSRMIAPAGASASSGAGGAPAPEAKKAGFFQSLVSRARKASEPQPPPGAPPPAMKETGAAIGSPVESARADEDAVADESERAARDLVEALAPLEGRIALRGPARLVLELAVTRAFWWSAPAALWLRLPDGTTIACALDETASTRRGPLEAGLVLRIALRLDERELRLLEQRFGPGTHEPAQLIFAGRSDEERALVRAS